MFRVPCSRVEPLGERSQVFALYTGGIAAGTKCTRVSPTLWVEGPTSFSWHRTVRSGVRSGASTPAPLGEPSLPCAAGRGAQLILQTASEESVHCMTRMTRLLWGLSVHLHVYATILPPHLALEHSVPPPSSLRLLAFICCF